MKLTDIPKGSPLAYQEAIKLLREQIEFELETCKILFGTDPQKVLELLAATPIFTSEDDSLETTLNRLPPT